MNPNEKDRKFFDTVDRNFTEPTFPGMTERLEGLFESGIGRGLLVNRATANTSRLEVIHAGYILPLNKEQTQHIVVLRTGEIFKTTFDGEEHERIYKTRFAPNKLRITFGQMELEDLSDHFNGNTWLRSRVLMYGDAKEHIDQLTQDLHTALRTAISMKEEGQSFHPDDEIEELVVYRGNKVTNGLENLESMLQSAELDVKVRKLLESGEENQVIEVDDIPYGPEE